MAKRPEYRPWEHLSTAAALVVEHPPIVCVRTLRYAAGMALARVQDALSQTGLEPEEYQQILRRLQLLLLTLGVPPVDDAIGLDEAPPTTGEIPF